MSSEEEGVDPSNPIYRIIEAVKELGWHIATPVTDNDEDLVVGMIIGIDEYVDLITGYVDELDDGAILRCAFDNQEAEEE